MLVFQIIVLVPLISAATAGFSSYKMIVYGSFLSGLSPFVFLAGSSYLTASLWVIVLSLGEAVWSPRLYEYCAMVAPAGKEGVYMSMSSVPLFAAPIVAGGMSGSLLERYCPTEGVCNGPMLWGIVGIASASSPVLMVLFAKVIQVRGGWLYWAYSSCEYVYCRGTLPREIRARYSQTRLTLLL